MRALLGVALGLVLAGPVGAGTARADDVVLRGGTRVAGVVLERGEAGVLLLLPGGDQVRFGPGDVAEVVADADAPAGARTVRWAEPAEGEGRLQTAVVTLVSPAGGPRVDLVGVVHIGDRGYYRDVQALLERADVVLFEMVKPQDVEARELDTSAPNPFRDFQAKLARALDLVFQLDAIAYDRPHFVHADVSAEELAGTPARGGEGGGEAGPGAGVPEEPALPERLRALVPVLKMMGAMLDRLATAASPADRAQMRRALGRALGALGPRAGTLLGDRLSEMLLDRRNAVVVERLAEVPAGATSVAVLYGAAHLPDLEARITETLGYRRAGARWMDAWRPAAAPTAAKPAAEPAAVR